MSDPIATAEWFWPAFAVLAGLMVTMCLHMLAGYVEHHSALVKAEAKLCELRRANRQDDGKAAPTVSRAPVQPAAAEAA